jgi:hypothetical protein
MGLPIAPPSETAHYDLTKLDDEELETLFGLLRKAEPD